MMLSHRRLTGFELGLISALGPVCWLPGGRSRHQVYHRRLPSLTLVPGVPEDSLPAAKGMGYVSSVLQTVKATWLSHSLTGLLYSQRATD